MIPATALVQGLTLITTNGNDFRDVPGLELVSVEYCAHDWQVPQADCTQQTPSTQ